MNKKHSDVDRRIFELQKQVSGLKDILRHDAEKVLSRRENMDKEKRKEADLIHRESTSNDSMDSMNKTSRHVSRLIDEIREELVDVKDIVMQEKNKVSSHGEQLDDLGNLIAELCNPFRLIDELNADEAEVKDRTRMNFENVARERTDSLEDLDNQTNVLVLQTEKFNKLARELNCRNRRKNRTICAIVVMISIGLLIIVSVITLLLVLIPS